MKKLLLSCLALAFALTGWAQERVITGRVTSAEDGTALPGVNVVVKGTTNGTVTDVEGMYNLNVPSSGAVLQFSFVGLKTLSVAADAQNVVNVALEADVSALDEVQIIGYGSTTKRLNTGAVATLKNDALTLQPITTDFNQMMAGKLAGVALVQSTGGVGAAPSIFIRGQNTFRAGSTDPLYIVDGVIISSAYSTDDATKQRNTTQQSSNPLNTINPADISSIEVLKDADATAIYGARGANGVILITTRRPATGALRINADFNTGFNENANPTNYLNTEQYKALRYAAFDTYKIQPTLANAPDLFVNPTNTLALDRDSFNPDSYFNYPKYAYGNRGRVINGTISLSGGGKELNYLVSGTISDNNDVLSGNQRLTRKSVRSVVSHTSANNKFALTVNNQFNAVDLPTVTNTNDILSLPPTMPLYNERGKFFYNSGSGKEYKSPLFENQNIVTRKTKNYLGSLTLSYELVKGLQAKVDASYGYLTQENTTLTPSTAALESFSTNPTNNARTSSHNFQSNQTLNLEPQLTYNKSFGKLKFNGLVGSTWFQQLADAKSISFRNYTTDALVGDWGSGNLNSKSSTSSEYDFRSWFARAGFNWDGKYIVNLTGRADGSSRFGKNNRWGNFGAIGASWIISNEDFMKDVRFISFAKVRSSYGRVGNDKGIQDYAFYSTFQPSNPWGPSSGNGIAQLQLANPNLKWETTDKFDLGLEFGFLNDRISGSITFFESATRDFLTNISYPQFVNGYSQTFNVPGLAKNTGVEITLNTTNIQNGKFKWTSNFNLTTTENKLVEIALNETELEQFNARSDNSNKLYLGKSISNLSGYKYLGVDPANGTPLFQAGPAADLWKKTPEYLLNLLPTLYGGFGNTITFGSFTLDFSISFNKQNLSDATATAGVRPGTQVPGAALNIPDFFKLEDFWRKPGDNAKYPRLISDSFQLSVLGNSTTTPDGIAEAYRSAMPWHDSYFLRLRNASLTYQMPKKLLQGTPIQAVAIYVRGQNLMSYTPVDLGKDPEIRGSVITPQLRTIVAGFNITF